MLGYLDDLLWLVLVVLLCPVLILVVGMPVVLVARLMAEIWQRW